MFETNCPLTKCHISEDFNFLKRGVLALEHTMNIHIAVIVPTCSYLTDLVTVHNPVLHVPFLSVQIFQL